MRRFAVLALLLAACASSPLQRSRQLIVVTTPDWDATRGTMQRYERDDAQWRAVGAPAEVFVGRSGLAWGRGAVPLTGEGPVKREGDGRAPAGVFTLGTAFGFDERGETKLPWMMLRSTTECVDDAKSAHYNTLVERGANADWDSSEKMRAIDDYRYGVVVEHNTPPERGAGSCIFLHLASGKPTAGCTSMRESDLVALLAWLDPAREPRIVQLPSGDYARLRARLALP
ncbi:MAG: hypothetical protein M3Q69_20900 [Acidobacteriota bacterium]|nr:hypothetical protein [Acidobacteriota bacterium]